MFPKRESTLHMELKRLSADALFSVFMWALSEFKDRFSDLTSDQFFHDRESMFVNCMVDVMVEQKRRAKKKEAISA